MFLRNVYIPFEQKYLHSSNYVHSYVWFGAWFAGFSLTVESPFLKKNITWITIPGHTGGAWPATVWGVEARRSVGPEQTQHVVRSARGLGTHRVAHMWTEVPFTLNPRAASGVRKWCRLLLLPHLLPEKAAMKRQKRQDVPRLETGRRAQGNIREQWQKQFK